MRTKREKNLVLLMLLIVAAAVIMEVTAPSSKPLGTTAGPVYPYAVATKKYHDGVTQYLALGRQEDVLTPQIQKLAQKSAPDQLVPAMINTLMKQADKASVHISSLRPLQPVLVGAGQALQVPIQMQFSAPFHPDTLHFLYLLENPANRFVIDRLDVSTDNRHPGMVNITAQVSAFTTNVSSTGGISHA